MDSCDWSETRFNEIKEEITKMIKSAGFLPKRVPIIPYSGFRGENLVDKTDKMSWYKGWEANISKEEKATGYTLYDALEKLARPPKRNTEGKLKFKNGPKIKVINEKNKLKNNGIKIKPNGIKNLKLSSNVKEFVIQCNPLI